MTIENSIMVFIEQRDGKVADVSLELICEAKRLAKSLGVPVTGVAAGHHMSENLKPLGGYGCEKVYYTDDKRLSYFTSVPYAKVIVKTIKKYHPQIVLFGASTTGRDVAPRVASEMKCGLTADCTELKIGNYKTKSKEYKNILHQIRPAFGGNIIATIVSPEGGISMATVREGVMKMSALDISIKAEVIKETCDLADDDFMTEVIEIVRKEKRVNLKSAQIIVSAGMGANSPEALKLVKELASVLGGEVGSSRPVVDSGTLSRERQVGQTGTTVRPNLYIACGISGQIQHRAGMAEAKRIIAINSDENAPIFDIAHYGIVGDVCDVIPKMIKAYKAEA
ncbi:MAG: electron transfer flavoprotein subunit alpha/FixB family protein [Deltaproteobacteria bacterium]|nr:electron transfer flavoprotein subunit alpha/FixB family protein [Deltaproteobacteria bacterium]MBW2181241.1 electron transfer flavoprotein subunit alpha/FixB family protein [Deltaproteobacteria bacterium]